MATLAEIINVMQQSGAGGASARQALSAAAQQRMLAASQGKPGQARVESQFMDPETLAAGPLSGKEELLRNRDPQMLGLTEDDLLASIGETPTDSILKKALEMLRELKAQKSKVPPAGIDSLLSQKGARG